jgi:hypothetical protein
LGPGIDGTGYLLTASVGAVGGFALASMHYAPRLAVLAKRVESAERSLAGQGMAISELVEALNSLLTELDGKASGPSQQEAISAARWALSRR